MILAGDVGGTKTILGLFDGASPRPGPVAVHSFDTQAFTSFTAILDAFSRVVTPFTLTAAAFGVAGPVLDRRANLTNVEWDVAADDVIARFGRVPVVLLNDLEAMATSVEVLDDSELEVLQAGQPRGDGNAVVIAAGTGLGTSFLHRVGGRLTPVPSEGGHADFAARTDDELEFTRMLRQRYGRAEVEQVLSGRGFVNLHRFTHQGRECAPVGDLDAADAPARISTAGLSGRCESCAAAVRMFVAAYGAEAGNLALRGVATAGVYVGGGIAPKILPALRDGVFMQAFGAKAPMADLLARVPVRVILNPQAGLLGAAVSAAALAHAR